ncbi:hypothetical protein GZH47_27440 [Paenibacillus rhizovicinus]|uniref:Uncharacterized protein n=1 Tax=Paenibacillus rhizovicinus TaxID=2704463 RepID=A0A6C0P6H3_9BACL|nr:hypothetical protein [Paenibacillus rhizovicinus]QHW34160.1 hypothetical protein GZH47_27440 [Paenibacillus rhizovicinus]
MNLLDYYRDAFVEATSKFEPVWEQEFKSGSEYQWVKRNYPYTERFQLLEQVDAHPKISFSIELPEQYMNTSLIEEVANSSSRFDLFISSGSSGCKKMFLSAVISVDHLQHTVMGHLHQVRSEILSLLEMTIEIPMNAGGPTYDCKPNTD